MNSFFISLIVPLLVIIFGDSLYIGLWYYLLIPAVIIPLHMIIFKFPRTFYMGLSVGISLSFLFFLSLNWFKITNDDLLGLLHLLFVLPAVIFSILISSIYIKNNRIFITLNNFKFFLIALSIVFIGFIIAFIAYIGVVNFHLI